MLHLFFSGGVVNRERWKNRKQIGGQRLLVLVKGVINSLVVWALSWFCWQQMGIVLVAYLSAICFSSGEY